MRQAFYALAAILLSFQVLSAEIEVGDIYRTKSDIKFLEMDNVGVFSIMDHFVEQRSLSRDSHVKVVEVSQPNMQVKQVQGRFIHSCSRTILLEIQNCDIEGNITLEQIIEFGSPRTRMNLFVRDQGCFIRYHEGMDAFCSSPEDLIDSSKFNSFFLFD